MTKFLHHKIRNKRSWNLRWKHIGRARHISIVLGRWAASSEFGTYRLCEQRRFRRACASAQSRQNLRCSLIQAVSQEEPSDRKPDPWLLWMAGHAQLKFVMTECSKTQIRLTRLKSSFLLPVIELISIKRSCLFFHVFFYFFFFLFFWKEQCG